MSDAHQNSLYDILTADVNRLHEERRRTNDQIIKKSEGASAMSIVEDLQRNLNAFNERLQPLTDMLNSVAGRSTATVAAVEPAAQPKNNPLMRR